MLDVCAPHQIYLGNFPDGGGETRSVPCKVCWLGFVDAFEAMYFVYVLPLTDNLLRIFLELLRIK